MLRRRLPEQPRPPEMGREIVAGGIRIEIVDCATGATPEAAFGEIGPRVRVGAGSRLGPFAELGPCAVVGHGTRMGSWSTVGAYSRVGNGVRFGDWAHVGMDCVVDSGSVLGPHEYIPSGHRRHSSGRLTRLPEYESLGRYHHLYDRWREPSGFSGPIEIAEQMDHEAYEAGKELAGCFREYLEQREAMARNPFIEIVERLTGRRLRPVPQDAFLDWRPTVRRPRRLTEGDEGGMFSPRDALPRPR